MNLRIWNYGNYKSDNYGSSRAVQVGDLTLYFSYKTIVAFREAGKGTVITKNRWSSTTGRHLNCISKDKTIRVEYDEFLEKLNQTLNKYQLVELQEKEAA